MAATADTTLFLCVHCQKEKIASSFAVANGYRKHKCTSCVNYDRRAKYSRREGSYKNHDTEENKEKRRLLSRQSSGRYVWEESWLQKLSEKKCSRCKDTFTASPEYFSRNTKSPSGLASWCKLCAAQNYSENKLQRLNSCRLRYRKRMKTEPDKMRDVRRSWRERNPAKNRGSVAKWTQNNLELSRARKVASQSKRRARQRNAAGDFTTNDIKEMFTAQNGRCWYCSTKMKNYHVEHRIPLARGGSNGLENIVLACPPCNLSKGTKMPWEMKNARLV